MKVLGHNLGLRKLFVITAAVAVGLFVAVASNGLHWPDSTTYVVSAGMSILLVACAVPMVVTPVHVAPPPAEMSDRVVGSILAATTQASWVARPKAAQLPLLFANAHGQSDESLLRQLIDAMELEDAENAPDVMTAVFKLALVTEAAKAEDEQQTRPLLARVEARMLGNEENETRIALPTYRPAFSNS